MKTILNAASAVKELSFFHHWNSVETSFMNMLSYDSPGKLWNDPPLIATEIIPSPTVSENVLKKHLKRHQESQ